MFENNFYGVYEKSDWIVQETWLKSIELDTVGKIREELKITINSSSYEKKLSLLCCHPQLAGKLARENNLTKESKKEQNSAGLSECSPNELNEITRLNKLYLNKFKFPFIVAVSGMKVKEIILTFRNRLNNMNRKK